MYRAQSKQVSAQVPRLSEVEFGALMCALRAAAESTIRPISFREAQQLPVDITNVYEGFAYAENATCRIINSFSSCLTSARSLSRFRCPF